MFVAMRVAKHAFVLVSVAMTAAQLAEWHQRRGKPKRSSSDKNYEVNIPPGVKP